MKRVQGKVILITGGASGIGRETCLLLADHGATIAVTDISTEAGKQLADKICELGGKAKFWFVDVSNEKEVEGVYAEVFKRFGKLDGIVNNAGIAGADKPTHELTEDEWDAVMNINVKGVFLALSMRFLI